MTKHKSSRSLSNFEEFFRLYRWWLIAAVLIILLIILLNSLGGNSDKDARTETEDSRETDAFYEYSFGEEIDDNIPFSDEPVIDSPPIN